MLGIHQKIPGFKANVSKIHVATCNAQLPFHPQGAKKNYPVAQCSILLLELRKILIVETGR